ncbi:DUF732 domain-containing protein [Mycobacterium sp. E740]|uniref:DUF732 domain-containing protein n=1 Tax=Mycobacterium sp. E740 TaxID=1834149 RepID=UPI0007FF9BFF|nr:DUF732 domain-containing protein [Mycobacterium sp. E740]OBI77130.1 DUF732 domain-containing protein [Mycobacterium sp. E740]
MQRSVRTAAAGPLLIASATALLTGCSGNAVMATMGMPTTESAPAPHGSAQAQPGPAPADGQSHALVVTDRQRAYLDGLAAEGVKPSSDLLALSIGSYVCQARAARHSDQEVWDSVLPMVRSDTHDRVEQMSGVAASSVDVNADTSDYIRIATERLC